MRATASIAALAFALLQGADAFNAAKSRDFNLLADMGFNPDGSSIETAVAENIARSLHIGTTVKGSSVDLTTRQAPETIAEEFVSLKLDHFGKNKDVFNNRFWVAESGYKAGGPVFIYDVGEADASGSWKFRLQNETSFFKQIVDQFGGVGIVWEHRFYGKSTPAPINLDTPAETFRYHTTEQSLADVDQFAKQFKRQNINATLTPDKTPWIFIGGSYPAMRAAFIRDKYPDTIYAGYASSAPVEASVDQSFYFEPVYRGMNRYGFGNCTQDIKAAIKYIDHTFDTNPAASAKLKEQFLGKGAAANSHATFADALTTIFYLWQSYGVDGGAGGLRNFCDWIETDPATNATAPASGWAAVKGAKSVVDRWAAWKTFTPLVNSYLETTCPGTSNATSACDLNKRFSDPASISWTWQYCTQWGYFQAANLGPNQVVSKFNSLTHQRDICHRQFPNAPRSLLPEWPATDKTNKVFGGWDIRPSNVYWSGGEFDPWRTLSPLSAEPFAPKVHAFTDAPKCGKETSKKEVFGYTMKDAQHCYDFRTYFAPGAVSRKYFTDALSGWLKCFKPKGGYGYARRWDA
ncbi:serine carboxypeptidase S28-domain-containing protein [Boeremia exigua]|uniref:serine carboxypeptidase S28-domain-containing protein n=1 Tax=Boeremia exigua TaxID=749465 RepID=UPI001E8E4FF0|nr:serine carboxypeptidase S28-domain-containing protein [Boeremia exigua]KAH6639173.1 serine carboxypeptidase S28-domain-containing protein [Boeremia exigua]